MSLAGLEANPPARPIRWASVGDTIECRLSSRPGLLRVRVPTPEACAFANELIADGFWWVVEEDGPEESAG